MARKRQPMKMTPWAMVLQTFDSRYFDYNVEDGHRQPASLDDAAYDLATWFFDNTKQSALKKMLTLPEELWTAALKNWRDHHHDT